MPKQPDPNSQAAVARFFKISAPRLCRLLQRHAVDYRDERAVAAMLRRSTAMTPDTRAMVDAVLGAAGVAVQVAPPTAPPTPLESLEKAAQAPPPRASTVEDAEAFLETLKRSLAIAEETSSELRSLGQFEDARRWLALHAQLSKQFGPLSRQITALKVEAKDLVSCVEAQLTFTSFIKMMRGLVERMPPSLAGKVAPHDPEGARSQLEIWVNEVFCKTLHASAPDVTKG